MRYPRCSRHLVFEDQPDGTVKATDYYTKDEWKMQNSTACFLQELDGHSDPYLAASGLELSPEAIRKLMKEFDEEGLLDADGRIVFFTPGFMMVPLWRCRNRPGKKRHTSAADAWIWLLLLLWLPCLCQGLFVFLNESPKWKAGHFPKSAGEFAGCFLGLLFGMLLHEASHIAAAVHYGGKVYETGIGLGAFCLPGSYAIMEINVKNRFKRAQISAAGAKANLLLAGCCFLLLKENLFDSRVLVMIGLMNLTTAAFNLSFIDNLDGAGILQAVLGAEDHFVTRAAEIVVSSDARNALRERGLTGKLTLAACWIITFFQILLFLTLFLNYCGFLLYLL